MKANDGRSLFGYFVHAVQLVDDDVAWHHAVWVVDDQFWVVEIFAALPVHAVTAVGRAPYLCVRYLKTVFLSRQDTAEQHGSVCVRPLSIVVALRRVGRKVETVAEPLEIYVPLNALAVHSKLTDATDPALVVAAASGLVDNVARQLGSMVVLLDALKTCR